MSIRSTPGHLVDTIRYMVTIYGMDKTTVYLDTGDYRRLKVLAKEAGRPVAELVREAVAQYAARHTATVRPSSIGIGRSGRGDLSEYAEDLLGEMGEF